MDGLTDRALVLHYDVGKDRIFFIVKEAPFPKHIPVVRFDNTDPELAKAFPLGDEIELPQYAQFFKERMAAQ